LIKPLLCIRDILEIGLSSTYLRFISGKMDDMEASECEALSQSEFMSGITTLTGPTGSGLATLGLHDGQGRQTDVENVGMDVAGQLVHLQHSTARRGHLLPSNPETVRGSHIGRRGVARPRLMRSRSASATKFYILNAHSSVMIIVIMITESHQASSDVNSERTSQSNTGGQQTSRLDYPPPLGQRKTTGLKRHSPRHPHRVTNR